MAAAHIGLAGIFSNPSTTSTFTGDVRSYEISSHTDLATTSYQLEVTITVNNGQGLGSAFLGIGTGAKNSAFYDEPLNALHLLLGPSDFNSNTIVGLNQEEQGRIHEPGNGTHRVRLTWDADNRRAMIEIHPHWVGSAVFTPSIVFPISAPQLVVSSSVRFFCGGARGVTFSDLTISPLLGANSTVSFPGTQNFDRSYLRSAQADLDFQSYQAEVTLTVNGGGGVGSAFFGIGKGEADPASYYEPKDALGILVGPTGFGNAIMEVRVNGAIATSSLDGLPARRDPGAGNGTHRVRITWDSDNRRALVEVHANWTVGATFSATYEFLIKAPQLAVDATGEYRFFCGGAMGVTFTDFSAKPLLGPYETVFGPPSSSAQRSYLISAQTDLASQSYRAEVTMTMSSSGPSGSAFIGIGGGRPNAAFYDTPTTAPSAGFTIPPPDFDGGQISAWLDATKLTSPHPIGWAAMGTHRLRFRWDAVQKVGTLDIHKDWVPGVTQTFVATASRRIVIDASSKTFTKNQRFFCGGASGVTFSDFSATAIPANEAFPHPEPSAGTWLPAGVSVKPIGDVTPMDSLMNSLGGSSRLLGSWYDGTALRGSRAFTNGLVATGSQGSLTTPVSAWESTVTASNILQGGVVEGQNLTAKFKLVSGAAITTSVAMAFDFTSWTPGNYVFAPAMLYNGNRFRIIEADYPPFINEPTSWPLGNMPITTANILHLGQSGRSLVEMLSWNLATPMVGFYDTTRQRGLLILTDPKTARGVTGLTVEEDLGAGRFSLIVSAPGVRASRYTGFGTSRRGSTVDLGMDFFPGDEVTMNFKVYNFAAASIPNFLAKAFEIRKALSGQNSFRDITPFSAAAEMITAQHDTHKWYETSSYGYFSAGGQGNHQIGWNGNPVFGLPQAILSNTERLRRVGRSLDMLTHAQASTGLFYAMFNNGNLWGDTFGQGTSLDYRIAPNNQISLIRRSGEVLNFGLQQLMVLEDTAKPVATSWKSMLEDCADGLVALYAQHGQFGQFVNVTNGQMYTSGSTAGAACIGALAVASVYFNDPAYLATAEAAGEMYYQRDLAKGYTGGAPAEIMQCPDMEAAWALGDSYMKLYEITQNSKWLNYARDAINMMASFTVSYDYAFPPGSRLGQLGVNATGSIFASPQNNHSSPGIYIGSGDFLLKYYRATGDVRYRELYKDVTRNAIQYLNTPSNRVQLTSAAAYVTERVQLSDWEGGNMGHVDDPDTNQAWECMVQLVCLQNPGIYLNITTGEFLVLDHVKTELVSRSGLTTRLKLTNTTAYPAKVKVLAETAAQAALPLHRTSYLGWPEVSVNQGQTVYVEISPTGSISPYTP